MTVLYLLPKSSKAKWSVQPTNIDDSLGLGTTAKSCDASLQVVLQLLEPFRVEIGHQFNDVLAGDFLVLFLDLRKPVCELSHLLFEVKVAQPRETVGLNLRRHIFIHNFQIENF